MIYRKIPQINSIGAIFILMLGSINHKIACPVHYSMNGIICLGILMLGANNIKPMCMVIIFIKFYKHDISENTIVTEQFFGFHITKFPQPLFKIHLGNDGFSGP